MGKQYLRSLKKKRKEKKKRYVQGPASFHKIGRNKSDDIFNFVLI